MNPIKELYQQYKPAILFLVRFLGVYIVGNIIYGIWIESFATVADPITQMVTTNSAWFLNLLGYEASTNVNINYANVSLIMDGDVVVNVYEGCNAINVSILFLAFIIAYKGPLKRTFLFGFTGLLLIYWFNLFRVSGLFLIARFFPDHLYLMHKFVFTGVIYAFVFGLWFIWVKRFAK